MEHSQSAPREPLRLLYIARAYPPTLGGMETFAHRLAESLSQQAHVVTLVNRRGKKALPLFLPYALASASYLARRHRVQAIHLADALLAPLGWALKRATGLPVTSSVCGLDVTYPNPIYQSLVPRSLARLDMTMPISRATEEQVRERAGPLTPTTVIPLGVNPLPTPDDGTIRDFRRLARVGAGDKVLLTVGRLVKRKGVAWFVEQVLPHLPNDVVYVVIGEGAETAAIEAAGWAAGVAARVRMLGRVSDKLLAAAYRCADLFVMPNVPVPGDMEGFGLVALEASASGLPVVASRLEGINEAIQHEHNGLLISPRSADDYVATLTCLLGLSHQQVRALGESFAEFTLRTYGWEKTARRYLDVIGQIAA